MDKNSVIGFVLIALVFIGFSVFENNRARKWAEYNAQQDSIALAQRIAVQDSLANFVFARCPAMPGGQLYAQLKKAGILVRHFDAPRTADWLRITIGSQGEMESLIEAVKRIIGKEQRPCAQPL